MNLVNYAPLGENGLISVLTTDVNPSLFLGGFKYDPDTEALLVADGGTVDHVLNGLPFTATGQLVVDGSNPIAYYLNGIGFTAGNRVAAANEETIVGYRSGWPLSAGKLATTGLLPVGDMITQGSDVMLTQGGDVMVIQ